jgi:endonuclease/exonuclease/phosphatase (EEP) superfamily protein YafD
LETLQASTPDVIWLSEVPATRPAALEEAFDVMAAAYPYGMAWAPAPGRELRFLSRFPLRAREEFNPERARGRPGMRLVLDVQGQLLTVYALHTHPPTQAWSLKARNEALSWVGARVAASDGPVLVLGDLNTSAFSPFFRRWVGDSGLRCPSPWTCATGTWPAPWRPLVTPIDHVLAKGALQVQSLKRGPATGSDHYPLQAELTLKAPQP